MMHWFMWNNKNSLSDFGLWISKLPKLTRAPERYDTVEIPGRAGSLILTEGDDVYDSYQKECRLVTRNTNPKLQQIVEWLRGDGSLAFSNEIEMGYSARIVNQVDFERLGNNLLQAKIIFFCEPLKYSRFPEKDAVTFTASGTIYNRGDVASRPKVTIEGSGNLTVTIAGQSMTFTGVDGTIEVDCDAGIVTTLHQGLFTNKVQGDFWRIPTGISTVTVPSSTEVTIEPRWRWV